MRFGNGNRHPGIVDISIEEDEVDCLLKTPAPRKTLARNKKNVKSAEEVKASIQQVAAYERQSLIEELVNATPQPLVIPAPSYNPPDFSDEEDDSNANDNASYKPPSESTLDVLMTNGEVGSLPKPMGETVGQANAACAKNQRKGVVKWREEDLTELDDEPTPFKKMMGKRGMSVNSNEQTLVSKGKGQSLVVHEDSVTESDGEPSLQKKVIAAPAKSMQGLKASAVIDGLTAGSDTNHIQHVVVTTS